MRILTEPRNALVKQYQKMFEIDGVALEFTEDAVEAVADQALARGTGARGLRAIMEEVLLPVMFDVPSDDEIAKVVVSSDVVYKNVNPTIVRHDDDTEPQAHAAQALRLTAYPHRHGSWPGTTGVRSAGSQRTCQTTAATTQRDGTQPRSRRDRRGGREGAHRRPRAMPTHTR